VPNPWKKLKGGGGAFPEVEVDVNVTECDAPDGLAKSITPSNAAKLSVKLALGFTLSIAEDE